MLGDHAQQKGSLVEPERLRFDFSHFEAPTEEELNQIEAIVNQKIRELDEVNVTLTSLDEARKMGATALFGEKYGEQVRVVSIGDFSMELCGGTHVNNIGRIGLVKVVSESSVGAGMRRIEALTGSQALAYLNDSERELKQVSARLKTAPHELTERIDALFQQLREKERELESLKTRLSGRQAAGLLEQAMDIAGVKVLVAELPNQDMNSLRANAEKLRDKWEVQWWYLVPVQKGRSAWWLLWPNP